MALKKYLCIFFCSFATRQNTNNKMKDTIYSFKMLSLLIVLAFSNYSMAQEVSLKKQDVKTKEKITRKPILVIFCILLTKVIIRQYLFPTSSYITCRTTNRKIICGCRGTRLCSPEACRSVSTEINLLCLTI